MWNNYTVHMLNPDKIETRQAEAADQRLADEARQAPDEGLVRSEHTLRATRKVVGFGTSRTAQLRHGAASGLHAVRHDFALAGAHLRHIHRPHIAIGHHRA
jgi:hypothetical protein